MSARRSGSMKASRVSPIHAWKLRAVHMGICARDVARRSPLDGVGNRGAGTSRRDAVSHSTDLIKIHRAAGTLAPRVCNASGRRDQRPSVTNQGAGLCKLQDSPRC